MTFPSLRISRADAIYGRVKDRIRPEKIKVNEQVIENKFKKTRHADVQHVLMRKNHDLTT